MYITFGCRYVGWGYILSFRWVGLFGRPNLGRCAVEVLGTGGEYREVLLVLLEVSYESRWVCMPLTCRSSGPQGSSGSRFFVWMTQKNLIVKYIDEDGSACLPAFGHSSHDRALSLQ